MKFLLLTIPSHIHIGTFELNLDNRQWTFSYSQDFIQNGRSRLSGFPDVNKTYGHEVCVSWLTSRIGNTENGIKGLRLAEVISVKGLDNKEFLELHSVQ